jgi:large subunit ribosomal protein L32
MSKKPTPKQKLCAGRSKRRYGAFQTRAREHLKNIVNLVTCQSCGMKVPSHTVCKECGKYRGKQILDVKKEMKKITKIKA